MLTDEEIDELSNDFTDFHGGIYKNKCNEFARAIIAADEAKRIISAGIKPPPEPTQADINAGIQAAQRLAYDSLTNNKKFLMADAYTLAIKTTYASALKRRKAQRIFK